MADPQPPALSPSSGPFELSGGALSLDYVNTWGDRARPATDQLRSFGDLLAFAGQTGLLQEAQRRRWTRVEGDATREPEAFEVACRLRESLYRIFAGKARGRESPAADLAVLNSVLSEALAHLRIAAQATGPTAVFAWSFEASDLPTSPLWPIARSAADLLTSPDAARITQCDGSDCTWLFLDRSRTGNRRWCSMSSCGNRAKARRHYRRNRG